MPQMRPATSENVAQIDLGLAKLREARDLFAIAGSPQTLERVRLAISSAKGAKRHINRRRFETEYDL